MYRFCVVGAGNIGSAMTKGLSRAAMPVAVYNRTPARLEALAGLPHVSCHTSLSEALRGAETVLVCVEGDAVPEILAAIGRTCKQSVLVGSCAAAVSLEQMEAMLGAQGWEHMHLFRLLPNIAATVGHSANLWCSKGIAKDKADELVRIFSTTGTVARVEERLFPAAMAISSCGIAYALRYVRANMLVGVQAGLTPAVARQLAGAVLGGTAAILDASDAHPEELIDRVTTPGGITIRGLNAMEDKGFSAAVVAGLLATLKK